MKKIRALIISMIVIIIFIIIIIVILKNNLAKDEKIVLNNQKIDAETMDTYETSYEIERVKNKNKYYAVEKILNTYIYYIKEIKGIIDFQKYDDETIIESGASQLYNILDPEYISKYNIKKSDLQNKIKEYDNYDLKIKEMYLYEKSSSINIYIVYANLGNDDLQLIIKTDSQNMTFSVFLDDYMRENKYGPNMYIESIEISDDNIEKNNDNQYRYVNITDEYMAVQYMDSLKDNLLNNIQYTYENLLDNEYKNTRFGNIESYMKYINDNKAEIEQMKIKKFNVNYYDNYTEYVCMDQYENYYIFKENYIMDYTFKLDTYTIITENFEKTYKTANSEKKVQMNIDKFIQMINRHDYITSYNCLADSFKSNYFKTQEEFENYIKNNFFAHNKLKFKNFEEKGNNIYACTIQLTDLTGENSEIKEITIIMKLNDNLDFEMSFSIE